jgi:hypothetical protein
VFNVPLGKLEVCPLTTDLIRRRLFDMRPFLNRHSDGDGGELLDTDQIFEHISNVLKAREVRSVFDTPHGEFVIVTNAGRTRTFAEMIP